VRISIITAVLADKDDHLGALWDSLQAQEMPVGWDWQWVLQEDGNTGRPIKRVPKDPRISTGMAPWAGVARARTLALSRADGALARAVDADDVLPPGALRRDIEVLVDHPEIGWCISPAIDLLEDGSTRRGPRDPDPGPLPAGLVASGERAGLVQVVGGTMTTYTRLIELLGGWPAVPIEDIGLLLAVEAVASGWMQEDPGLLYRRWPKATDYHKRNDKLIPSGDNPGRTVMLARVDALKSAGWTWTPAPLSARVSLSGRLEATRHRKSAGGNAVSTRALALGRVSRRCAPPARLAVRR
jgi:glycosyltransferase involved in cell wall biosynthesis